MQFLFFLLYWFLNRFINKPQKTSVILGNHLMLYACSHCRSHFGSSHSSLKVFSRVVAGRSMHGPAVVGSRHFHFIFCDQGCFSAEIRTVIFFFLYVPPIDTWPWEHPQSQPANWDLYHFSICSFALHRPCVTFLTVDTPSVASPASEPFD